MSLLTDILHSSASAVSASTGSGALSATDATESQAVAFGMQELFGVAPQVTTVTPSTGSPYALVKYAENDVPAVVSKINRAVSILGDNDAEEPSGTVVSVSNLVMPVVLKRFGVYLAVAAVVCGGVGYMIGRGSGK